MHAGLRRSLLAMLACLPLLGTGPASAQVKPASFSPQQRAEIVDILRNAMKTDPTILMDAIAAMQENEGRAKTANVTAMSGRLAHAPGDPISGNPSGDVTIVEFSDLRCPYCRRMLPVLSDLLRQDPNIRIVHKDLPVLGPGSILGAKAVLAAQKQGGYLKLHDALMAGTPNIDMDTVQAASRKLGLDWDRLKRDMEAPDVKARIDDNLDLARQLDVRGTPAYVIGGQIAPGAIELAELQDMVATARKH
jgi:protein-disulfide isomerase